MKEERFTRLCEVTYGAEDGSVEDRKWEMLQRTTRSTPFVAFEGTPAPIPIDAVEICAVLERAGERYLILVAQYRPPLDAVTIEFPAGLVDAGERPETASIRELREETGYVCTEECISAVSAPICSEPGLSDSCSLFVRLTVDGTIPENVSPKQQLDEGEDIEVVLLRIDKADSILQNLDAIVEGRNKQGHRTTVDAKLYTFLYGLSC